MLQRHFRDTIIRIDHSTGVNDDAERQGVGDDVCHGLDWV